MKPIIQIILFAGLFIIAGTAVTCAQEQASAVKSPIIRDGGTYYCGELQMDGAAYKRFLETECPVAYQQFKQGQQCMISGWTLLGFGLVSMPTSFIGWIVSGAGVVISDVANSEKPADPKMVFSNNSFFSLGVLAGAALISSVPLLTVGYKRMHKSVDTYNNQCVEPDVELALGLTGNGVGMTIRF